MVGRDIVDCFCCLEFFCCWLKWIVNVLLEKPRPITKHQKQTLQWPHVPNIDLVRIALFLFDKMPVRTVVSWNTTIFSYSNWGKLDGVFLYFR